MANLPRLQAQHEMRFSEKLGEASLQYIEKTVLMATENKQTARQVRLDTYRQRLTAGLEGF